MDPEVVIALIIAGALLLVLAAGAAGFFLALGLRRRVRALEGRLGELDLRAASPAGALPSAGREASRAATPPVARVEALPPALPPRAPPPRAPSPRGELPLPHRSAAPPPAPSPRSRVTLDSLERLLGTRLLNWVGALVSLVGVAFFLKFLYDRGWIGPAGRVAIGLESGLLVLAFGELKVRRIHDLLSQAVSAVGSGTLFLTTYLSYELYDFGGQAATFAFLAWIAAFTVALAVLRRGRALAVLGFISAYAVPILLSTGQDRAEALFSYLAVLALGSVAVRAAREWWEVTPLCLALSTLYYGGWYARFYTPERLEIAVAGAAGLIVLFGSSSLARGLWRRSPVASADALALSVAQVSGLYYLWITLARSPIGTVHRAVLGLALVGISLVDQAWIWCLRRRRSANAVVEDALLILAAGVLVLVIPAVLRAEGAVLAWSLAALLLAAMGARSSRLSLAAGAGACLLVAVAAGFHQRVAHTGVFWPAANRVFVAWLAVAAAWILCGRTLRRAPESDLPPAWRVLRRLAAVLQVAGLVILLALFTYETHAWFRGELGVPGADLPALREWRLRSLLVLWAAFPWLWLWRARRAPALWLLGAGFYAVLGLASLASLSDLHRRETILLANPSFIAGLLLPAAVFIVARSIAASGHRLRAGLEVYAHVLIVALLTAELHQGLSLKGWEPARQEWVRMAVVSVAWAAYGTATFWLGLQRGLGAWRWFAMSLLLLTVLKVFLVDMAEVRQIWRVLSFVVLGALLMGCSFIYVRHEKRKLSALSMTPQHEARS